MYKFLSEQSKVRISAYADFRRLVLGASLYIYLKRSRPAGFFRGFGQVRFWTTMHCTIKSADSPRECHIDLDAVKVHLDDGHKGVVNSAKLAHLSLTSKKVDE